MKISKFNWQQGLLFSTLALLVFVTDQVTKALVRANMDLGESIPAEGRFRLSYSTNSGSVFGLSLDSTFLLVMGIIVLFVILWLNFRYFKHVNRFMRVGLGLVMGGAMGNLLDRIRFGEVTDFIDVRLWGDFHWATFNVADASLSTGIVVLIYCFAMMAKPTTIED